MDTVIQISHIPSTKGATAMPTASSPPTYRIILPTASLNSNASTAAQHPSDGYQDMTRTAANTQGPTTDITDDSSTVAAKNPMSTATKLNEITLKLINEVYGATNGAHGVTVQLKLSSHWFLGILVTETLPNVVKRYNDRTFLSNCSDIERLTLAAEYEAHKSGIKDEVTEWMETAQSKAARNLQGNPKDRNSVDVTTFLKNRFLTEYASHYDKYSSLGLKEDYEAAWRSKAGIDIASALQEYNNGPIEFCATEEMKQAINSMFEALAPSEPGKR